MSSVTSTGAGADATTGGSAIVDWPAMTQAETYFTPSVDASGPDNTPRKWLGTFVQNGQGTTGMLYRRNRYFDPNTGRFTQEDPIGIAGGLNTYGFASGDPVNYGDPFGLCTPRPNQPCNFFDALVWNVSGGLQVGGTFSTGIIGGTARIQIWKVASLAVTTAGTNLSMSDPELSLELKASVLRQEGGVKFDLLSTEPAVVGATKLGGFDVGHESKIRRRKGPTSKFGMQAGGGVELKIDWGKVMEVIERNYNPQANPLANCRSIACQK